MQYHEARAQVKKIKTLQEDNKRRAERRAELTAGVVGGMLLLVGALCLTQPARLANLGCMLTR